MSKKKLNKYYIRFYETGEFRKIEAIDKNEAYKIAKEKFDKPFTIGTLLKVGDKIPVTGILLNRGEK